jgi:hypothetical protein
MRRWCLGLALLLTALPLGAQVAVCDDPYNNSHGPQSLFVNVHNCGTSCADQELPYLELYQDGISGVRISPVRPYFAQPSDPEFFDLSEDDPYFKGVFELFDADKVLVLLDHDYDQSPLAKPRPADMLRKLRNLFERYPQVRRVEFMNEPSNFSDITPEEYVARYLAPARGIVDQVNASRSPDEKVILYSAAWFGNQDGVRETQRMIRAGALAYADVISAHIYGPRVDAVRLLAREYKRLAHGKPVAVTETNFLRGNVSNHTSQRWWICESMVEMEALLRQGLPSELQDLQQNVLYTLRADESRDFNVISFADGGTRFWGNTGEGHFIFRDRSLVGTDRKRTAVTAEDDEDPSGGGEPHQPGGRRGDSDPE